MKYQIFDNVFNGNLLADYPEIEASNGRKALEKYGNQDGGKINLNSIQERKRNENNIKW